MTTASAVASPVYTSTLHGTAFLEVVPTGRGVRVQRTESGRTLNPFWTVWLQQLLFEKVDRKYNVFADVRDGNVNVSARMSAEGLIATIQRIACEIRPLPKPPIDWRHESTSPGYTLWWVDEDHPADVVSLLKTCKLPGKSRLSANCSFVELWRDPRMSDPTIGILRLMVELHLALALAPNGS